MILAHGRRYPSSSASNDLPASRRYQVKISLADQARYPAFTRYVHIDLPKVASVPAIVQAMRRIGQINRPTLIKAMTWKQGPSVLIVPIPDAYGEYDSGIKSDQIKIDTGLVKEFEAGKGKRVARAGHVFLVGVVLLHELVHWGDDKDGIDRPGEEGEEFEKLIYGTLV
jgi:hypothetical protein